MSEISNLIFHGKSHYISSPYGKRTVIKTPAGYTSPFHNGTDYATYGKKLEQYAVADGNVLSCGTDNNYGGAKYVWVEYPTLGVKMLHYHLDSISVSQGDKVGKNTILGTTGKTGFATGIHLHLGIKKIKTGEYVDPEQWARNVYPTLCTTNQKVYKPGVYTVTKAYLLNVRKGASTAFSKKSFAQLSKNAKSQIKKLNHGKEAAGYVKGVTFTVFETKGNWGRTPSGWVCLDYCEAKE